MSLKLSSRVLPMLDPVKAISSAGKKLRVNDDMSRHIQLINNYRIKNSFVRKKSPTIISTIEITTVKVVALPTPSVPPSVLIPT